MVITFKEVSFSYYEDNLLKDINFSFTDKDKVGLVGLNGTGKSTLLKLLTGELKPNHGEILITGGTKINYLSQSEEIPNGITAFEYVINSMDKEHAVKDYEAKATLTKLKINPDEKVDFFSGGQKKRLALAKCLVTYCDFLILDEPTNHLDASMILYLEKYLTKFNHGLFMVTHDRYFLERCCNKIFELDRKKIYTYEANYSKFLESKAEREDLLLKEENHLKKILKADREWMVRGVEARRTKQKYRIERFKEMSKIEFSHIKDFEFSSLNTYLGKNIIEIINGSKSYDDKEIFKNFNFSLLRTDHLGLVGDNGCGKTTLFKIIMGEEKLTSGTIKLGETLKIGYFSQHFVLDDESLRVIDYVKDSGEIFTLEGKISAKALLDKFLFDDKLQYSLIRTLSGGQKRRLQLVKILAANPNVLLLDEPTNDLDIYTMEVLENYLNNFAGPIITISHDRFFLDKVCDSILFYDNQEIKKYDGSYSDFLNNVSLIEENNLLVKENTKSEEKPKNKLTYGERIELEKLEKRIPQIEEQINILNKEIEDNYNNYDLISKNSKKLNELNAELENSSEKYMELLEKNS